MPTAPARAHVICGGFPPGQPAGHDHDYARLRLLELLGEQEIKASTANDFIDVERWLPISRLLTFRPNSSQVRVQCYLHTGQYAPQGWYAPAERTLSLDRPFSW